MLRILPILLLPAFALSAADPQPGHSSHGEAFNEGPRQAAVLIPGCGDAVKFPISTKKPEAQQFFTQGIGQLHGFWYYEAERSFRQVAAIDPGCAMAYWGMSMANVNNEKRAKPFLEKAVALKDKATPREKQWIAVLENLYLKKDDKRDAKQRQIDCIRDFEALVHDDPKDIEAKAFLVWRIWFDKKNAPIPSAQAVDALLDQIFAAVPNHPAHHYRIHLWDDSKPIRAVTSAAQCGQASPGIAHMWHMPGHTFSKLKRFDDAVWQQEASTRVDHAYMIRTFVLPDQIHNYAHNEEWLVRNFNELGRVKDAIGLASSLIGNPRHPSNNTLDKGNTSASYGRTRMIETLTKWELWDDLKAFTAAPAGHPSHDITRLRARGLVAFHQNDADLLASALKDLEAVKTDAKPAASAAKTKTDAAKTDAAKSKNADAKKAADKPAKPGEKPETKARNNALAELKALVALGKKNAADTSKLLDALKDTDVPKERLARYWLKLGDKTKAAALVPNFPEGLAGSAAKTEILAACGKSDDAKKAFEDTRKLAFAMDRQLPIAKRLDALAKTFGIAGDWPAAAPKRTDSGKRPALDTLGPVHWHPPVAPVFEALTLDNQHVKSSDFTAKKPTLFMFYLGHECGHCVEQIQAFAKAAADFDKAGIQLVAVTIEPTQVAGKIREALKPTRDQPLPFPFLSDSSLEAFKKVRAYDDFEKETLHATLLIDQTGHQRWQDISYTPFMDSKFLLEESQRLLKLPATPLHASE
ncbi:MAG: redoxin domain-containing protein [Prosthecobacter sp.]|jgi:peroxiredoxin|uniref:redoxin domain-containing protein n=1 Tax=Prosthecobacter sp. TaxID=1965333 RepID=UPI001A0A527E|nr:redoxin domain-containing protein [Prosthecobacter sp.]MBE2282133.1 redoxin domain-containing protein [Prosthecobacter sp.]